jgi:hypothetical protein
MALSKYQINNVLYQKSFMIVITGVVILNEIVYKVGMGMKSDYLNYPDVRLFKFGFESNSYLDLPKYPDYPDL